jgi:membrane peptidoglycan carboxypeptidase
MEWKLSVELEDRMTKQKFWEAYLNQVNMSETWGIQNAAKYYFGERCQPVISGSIGCFSGGYQCSFAV